MKYARSLKQSYFTAAHHQAFRREWEANFSKATSELKRMEKDGFLVGDALQRGALMESQAKRQAEALEKQGYEVKLVPVASWQGEQVVFLVARPSQRPKQEGQPKEEAQRIQMDRYTRKIARRFLFVTRGYVDEKELQKFWETGMLESDNGLIWLCHRDSDMAKQARSSKTFLFDIPDAFHFWTALNRAKLGSKTHYERFEVAKNFAVSIAELQRALDTFEYEPLKAYIDENTGNFMLVDRKGNVVLIREQLLPVYSITYDELKANFGMGLKL